MNLELGSNPELQILFDDPCLIAVNKPAGQLFQGHTHGFPQTLEAQVKSYIRETKPGSENVYLGTIHRLDRPVSGVVIFGRNSKFTSRLAIQFQKREVEKHYLAVVEGSIEQDAGELIDELADDPDLPPDAEDASSKLCQLKFKVVGRNKVHTTVDIALGTGRRNQIRRQFAKFGYPIIGDVKFGAKTRISGFENVPPLFQAIALHAHTLKFSHPKSEAITTLKAPKPSYWQTMKMD